MAKKQIEPDIDVLDVLTMSINREFGVGTLFGGENAVVPKVPKLSTGSIKLDIASGGGYGKGRIVEIYGPPSAGKTTLCLHAIKSAQQDLQYVAEGRVPLFADVEHALDLEYADQLGVDTNKLLITQPNNGEDALSIVDTAIRSGKISVCVVDSVASLVTKAELAGEINDSHVGRQARMMSQALKILVPICHTTGTVLIFTNQIRMKIGCIAPETEIEWTVID